MRTRRQPLAAHRRGGVISNRCAPAGWHGWQECLTCGAVLATLDGVELHAAHHEQVDAMLDQLDESVGDDDQDDAANGPPGAWKQTADLFRLADRANAEGRAVVGPDG